MKFILIIFLSLFLVSCKDGCGLNNNGSKNSTSAEKPNEEEVDDDSTADEESKEEPEEELAEKVDDKSSDKPEVEVVKPIPITGKPSTKTYAAINEFNDNNKKDIRKIYKLKNKLTNPNEEFLNLLAEYEKASLGQESLESVKDSYSKLKEHYDNNANKYNKMIIIDEVENKYDLFKKALPDAVSSINDQSFKDKMQLAINDYESAKTKFINNEITLEVYKEAYEKLKSEYILYTQQDKIKKHKPVKEDAEKIIEKVGANERKTLEAYLKLFNELSKIDTKEDNFQNIKNFGNGLDALKDQVEKIISDSKKQDETLDKLKKGDNFTKEDFQSLNEKNQYTFISNKLIELENSGIAKKKDFLSKIIDYAQDEKDMFLYQNQYGEYVYDKTAIIDKINYIIENDNNLTKKVKKYFTKRAAFFIVDKQTEHILKINYNTTIFNTKNNQLSATSWIKLMQKGSKYDDFKPFYFKANMMAYFISDEQEFNQQKSEIITKNVIDKKDIYQAILMRNADVNVINKVLADYTNDTKQSKNIAKYQQLISCALLNGDNLIITDIGEKLTTLIQLMHDKADILLYYMQNHALLPEKKALVNWFAKDNNQITYKSLYDAIKGFL